MNANDRFEELLPELRKVGEWIVSSKTSKKGEPYNIDFTLTEKVSDVVYFYVCSTTKELKYQGICTRPLEMRMREVKVGTQSYCARKNAYEGSKRLTDQGDGALNRKIFDNGGVDIYIYEPPKKLIEETHLGVTIKCHASIVSVKDIEKALNKHYLPQWNGQT